MTNTAYRWMLYVSTYTALFGIPLLFFPNIVLPRIGFAPTQEPWVRLVGGLLVALAAITFNIHRHRIAQMVAPTVGVRSWLILVLLAVGITGHYWFFFVMAGIVLVGVIGTLLALRGGTSHGA